MTNHNFYALKIVLKKLIVCPRLFQLIFGANDQKLSELKLTRDPHKYFYINQGGEPKVSYTLC